MEGIDWSAVIAAADELVRALLLAVGLWAAKHVRDYARQFVVNSVLSRAAGLVIAGKGEGSVVGGLLDVGVAYAQKKAPSWLGKLDDDSLREMVRAEVAKITAPTTTVVAGVNAAADLARKVTVGGRP